MLLGLVKAALEEVGIATNVTGPILVALLASVAGILIGRVGGGPAKPMQERLEQANAGTQPTSSRSDGQAAPPDRVLHPRRRPTARRRPASWPRQGGSRRHRDAHTARRGL